MPDLYLAKSAGGVLVPIDQPSADYIGGFAQGAGFVASVRRHNNPKFHRKMMSLYQLAYDAWEPTARYHQGKLVAKAFEPFRKDLTIQAGHYETYVDLRGRLRLEARSLNFSNMEQGEREIVFSDVANAILRDVLTSYTRADLDNVLAQVLEYTR